MSPADVLVIGAGPAGATAAFQLATSGVNVTLIDRAHFPRDKVCGESLSPGAIARLQAIGMWPVTDSFSPPTGLQTVQVRGMQLRSPRGQSFKGRYKGGPGGIGLAVRRTQLDHDLLRRAQGRGVRVIEGVEATAVEVTPTGGAIVSAREGGRGMVRFEARRVVVADGRRSFLARQLGFISPAASPRGRSRFAVRAHCENVAGLSDFAEMQVGDGGYCGIAPLSGSAANVCYVLFGGRLDMRPETIEADFRRDLQRFPEVEVRLQGARLQGGIRIVGPLRVRSRRQVMGPFIACGDTTGFLDPFTGEGIAHAIATGAMAARTVVASLAGDGDAFSAYAREVRALRRLKGAAALILHGLVMRPSLADAAATTFARMPRLADSIVQLFGDQV